VRRETIMTDTTTDPILNAAAPYSPADDEDEEAANAFRWAADGLRSAAAYLTAGNVRAACAGFVQAAEGLEFLAAAIYTADTEDGDE